MFQKKLLFTTEIDRVSETYTHTIVLPARNVFDKNDVHARAEFTLWYLDSKKYSCMTRNFACICKSDQYSITYLILSESCNVSQAPNKNY